jgi:hypothetical protein
MHQVRVHLAFRGHPLAGDRLYQRPAERQRDRCGLHRHFLHAAELSSPLPPDGRERFYSVVGYICETDTFGSNRRIAEISEGDYLAFSNAGAYCFSMASNYNSRYRPAEVLWTEGHGYLIRKRETFEDLIRNEVAFDPKEIPGSLSVKEV